MKRSTNSASGLYLCSRCRLHAFDTLGKKLEHERACTPANSDSDIRLHRSIERKAPAWLDDSPALREMEETTVPPSRRLSRVLVGHETL